MSPEEFQRRKAQVDRITRDSLERYRRAVAESADVSRRPIAAAEINDLHGAELAQRVYQRLEYRSNEGQLDEMSFEQWVVVALYHLDSEITNGGFHQYLWNTQALEIGQLRHYARVFPGSEAEVVIGEALARAGRYSYRRTWLMRKWKWWWHRQFERGYTEHRFDDLDDRYDALKPSMLELLSEYIRARPEAFCEAVS